MTIVKSVSGLLALCVVYLWASATVLHADPIIVSGGPDNDYESWIARLNDGRLMVIFDRNPDWASGDLYATFSTDDGASWSEAQAIIADDGDQATLSFVQTEYDTIRLWYASNEDGIYHIYAARSANGITWTRDGAVDLGWDSGTMYYDPTVILEVDGTFTMSYVVSGGGVYIAHSFDGFSWDTDKTQVSSSGYRARVMRHNNGTYLYAYHRRTGGTYEYDVFVRSSPDRVDWSDEIRLTANQNSHDPFANEMSDGAFMVYYAKYDGTAYNLYRRRSYNAVHWEPEEKITFDAVNNTQPHFFVESDDIYLVWAHAVNYPDDHDVYFEPGKDNYSILSLSPSQNELNVASAADVSVTFDKDMDPVTIDESSFVISSRLAGLLPGSVGYDVPTRTAHFDVSDDFLSGDLITAYLSNGILTDYGSPMGRDFIWTFTSQVHGGYGYFAVDSVYDAVDWLLSVCAADLDGDGFSDLIAGGGYQLSVLTNSGDGSFTGPVLHPIGWLIHVVTAGDLDGDGDLDVIAGCEGGEFEVYAAVFLNEGGGNLASPVIYMAPAPAMAYPTSVLVADLVGDGDLDVALTAGWSGSISVLYNKGDGTFAFDDGFGFYAGDEAKSLCSGDFDGDGDIDLACTNDMFGSIAIATNNGDGTFVPSYVYPPSGQPLALAAADLDADGDVDLAAAYASLDIDHVSIFSNDGTGSFVYDADYAVSENPVVISTGDFDGDGDIDLVTANGESDSISVLRNNGDATFATRWVFGAGSDMLSIATADLDSDGDLDLATADFDGGTVTVLFNRSWTPRTWHVSTTGSDETGDGSAGNPFSTIQRGIDSADPGDTVLVADGTYTGDGNRDMDFLGKDIVVVSEGGPDVTIIDCGGSETEGHNAFTFQSGETQQARLDGFTITGAYPPEPPWTGGVIRCLGSSSTIVNCVVSGNAGYGLYGADGSSLHLENCTISGNGSDGIIMPDNYGPGSSLEASGCLIQGNSYCGLCVVIGDNITVSNCTFVGNGSGILLNGEPPEKPGTRFGQVIVENTIVAYNIGSGIERIFWYPGLEFHCNNSYGNGDGDYVSIDAYAGDSNGNISQPPLFCDSASGDFHIHASSPCAPGYNDCGLFIGAFEIGCSEDYCGDADASGTVDIDDAVYLVTYIFASGPAPDPLDSGDPDCSGTVDIDDAVYLIGYIFGGGPVPCDSC